jgi:hypothetical protein
MIYGSGLLIAAALGSAGDAFSPPVGPDQGCLASPLQLRLSDLLLPSEFAQRTLKRECDTGGNFSLPRIFKPNASVTVGRLVLGHFFIGGQSVGFGIRSLLTSDRYASRALGGRPDLLPMDTLYLTPEIQLPPTWAWFVEDKIITPIAVTGSVALTAYVLFQLLR